VGAGALVKLGKALAKANKGVVSASDLAAAKKADAETWNEAEFLAVNPMPSGPKNSKEYKAWKNLYHKTSKKQELAVKRKAYVAANREKVQKTRKAYDAKNKEQIAAREKKYREENSEQIKSKQKETKKKNAKKIAKTAKQYRERNPEKVRESSMRWKKENKEHIRQYDRDRRDQHSEWVAADRLANPEKYTARAARARADRAQRNAPWADGELIQGIYRQATELSRATGIPHEVDHVIPLQGVNVSGLHHQDNLLIVPKNLNRSKSNSFTPGDDPLKMNDTARENAVRLNEEYLNNNPEAVADAIARKLKLIKEQHGR
jgi:hypothetical protein